MQVLGGRGRRAPKQSFGRRAPGIQRSGGSLRCTPITLPWELGTTPTVFTDSGGVKPANGHPRCNTCQGAENGTRFLGSVEHAQVSRVAGAVSLALAVTSPVLQGQICPYATGAPPRHQRHREKRRFDCIRKRLRRVAVRCKASCEALLHAAEQQPQVAVMTDLGHRAFVLNVVI